MTIKKIISLLCLSGLISSCNLLEPQTPPKNIPDITKTENKIGDDTITVEVPTTEIIPSKTTQEIKKPQKTVEPIKKDEKTDEVLKDFDAILDSIVVDS